jgi:YbgC/YbaW family acyl-CoA thioester hydrolase
MKKRVYYHHTDCGGVVYYANYLNFLEEARTEFFAEKGASIKEMAESGVMFVVSRQEVDYKFRQPMATSWMCRRRPAPLPGCASNSCMRFATRIIQLIIKARTVLVCVDKHLKPQAIPDWLRQKLS